MLYSVEKHLKRRSPSEKLHRQSSLNKLQKSTDGVSSNLPLSSTQLSNRGLEVCHSESCLFLSFRSLQWKGSQTRFRDEENGEQHVTGPVTTPLSAACFVSAGLWLCASRVASWSHFIGRLSPMRRATGDQHHQESRLEKPHL